MNRNLGRGLLVAVAIALLNVNARADDPRKPTRRANHLAGETSPYLLQHAHNPVDWHPWGPDAFARAKAENKPIFLSVGYSSCYWCHVMERESFENEDIAKILNEHFICIKVDREERPDVDQIYMVAVQVINDGNGGWPMSVFLFPDGRPFFGATYLPAKERDGMESFPDLLRRVSAAWRDHQPELSRDATALAKAIKTATEGPKAPRRVPLTRALAREGVAALAEQFDAEFGGFGYDPASPRRPKFPEPVNLIYLLDQQRRYPAKEHADAPTALAMTLKTLDEIARGGIRDHLAGGFHRYSVDRRWDVPHFEKMLYDNALLVSAFVAAFERTGDARWRTEAETTLKFIARSMTTEQGVFASAIDAGDAGDEGSYYVWKADDVRALLGGGDNFSLFATTFGLTREPNFEGDRHVLRVASPISSAAETQLAPLRATLLTTREKRPAPALDDKVLTSWNGLMLAALADAHRVFKDPIARDSARKAATYLLATHRSADGRLLRSSRAGKAKGAAYLDDYAFLTFGLLRLHAATYERNWLDEAKRLADRMLADFTDPAGGFFYTADDHESLLARPKDSFDNALPSGNSMAIRCLVELHAATNDAKYLEAAGAALRAFSPVIAETPASCPFMLLALEAYLDARGEDRAETDAPRTGANPDPLGLGPPAVAAKAAVVRAEKVLPGGEFDVELQIDVRSGWHIYAHSPGSDRVQPTTIALAKGAKAEIAAIDYPKGTSRKLTESGDSVLTYDGKVTIPLRVKLPESTNAGKTTITIRLRYQACDDRVCQAPAILEVPLELEVEMTKSK